MDEANNQSTDNEEHKPIVSPAKRAETVRTSSNTTRQPAGLPTDDVSILRAEPKEDIDTITILIPGNEKPTVFRNKEVILIGRRDEMLNFHPEVDLTDYYGVLMGVSRKHAEITLKGGQCFIKDLNSSNGSWLNEVIMVPGNTYPLKNGDQVRFGKLLLLVHLSSSKGSDYTNVLPMTDVRDMATVQFIDKTDTARFMQEGMTPSYLGDTLGNYLRGIATIQQLIRQLQEKASPPIAIHRVQVDELKHTIDVDMLNASDVVKFLYEEMPSVLMEKQQAFMNRQANKADHGAKTWLTNEVIEEIASLMISTLVAKFLKEKRDQYVEQLSVTLAPMVKSNLRIRAVIPFK